MEIISQYYGVIIVAIGVAIYALTHREIAITQAKKIASSLMLTAEAKARELLLYNGAKKKDFVIRNGYALLPKYARIFISEETFEIIIQELFDTAMNYVKNGQVKKNDK